MAIKNWSAIPLLFSVLLLFISGCGKGVEPVEFQNRYSADIIPGVGAGGIKLGTYMEDAAAILGQPDHFGHADGNGISWTIRIYKSGANCGMSIWFVNRNDVYMEQPADQIYLDSTYSGRTGEGFGIGTSKEEIISSWGNPAKSELSGQLETAYYSFPGSEFRFTYKNGKIYLMKLGPLLSGNEPVWGGYFYKR